MHLPGSFPHVHFHIHYGTEHGPLVSRAGPTSRCPLSSRIGPCTAPLAVALVYKAHGVVALLEHPGLAALRVKPDRRKEPTEMLALPAHDPLEDLLRGL